MALRLGRLIELTLNPRVKISGHPCAGHQQEHDYITLPGDTVVPWCIFETSDPELVWAASVEAKRRKVELSKFADAAIRRELDGRSKGGRNRWTM